MSIDEEVKQVQEQLREALHRRGYDGASVTTFADFSGSSDNCWLASYQLGRRGRFQSKSVFGKTFRASVDALFAEIEDLPRIWTDEQVAATLGIGVAA